MKSLHEIKVRDKNEKTVKPRKARDLTEKAYCGKVVLCKNEHWSTKMRVVPKVSKLLPLIMK